MSSVPDRQTIEDQLRDPRWQVRAAAFSAVKKNRYYTEWAYIDNSANRRAGRTSRHYNTFSDWCEDIGLAAKTGYKLAVLAESPHFQTFETLRTANISQTLAARLYQFDVGDPLFELLVLLLQLGLTEEEINVILVSDSPWEDACAVAQRRRSQIPLLLERLDQLLGCQTDPAT
jgi:hypothetical protein